MKMIICSVLTTVGLSLVVSSTFAAEPAMLARPTIAKICTNCHKAEAGTLRGTFDSVAFKSKTIQLKIDDSVELVKFDEDDLKVVNGAGKAGDGELLRSTKKGHEMKVVFVEENGVKTAVKVFEKPPVKVTPDMVITTGEVEKLVAAGAKGRSVLFDSRPLPRFKEGAIATAVSLPYPTFDSQVDKLPADKTAPIIFYCSGPTCNMSPGSADKAKKLGYSNVKVYIDGMPAWSKKNFAVLSVASFKEAWLDKNIPIVLLDARPEKTAAKGFIKGAVAFPVDQAAKMAKKLALKQKNAPIFVYDAGVGKEAETVARDLIKGGYENVKVVTGGFAAWKGASFAVETGTLSHTVSYTPAARPGEIKLAEFEAYAAKLPDNVIIIDVRNADEVKNGMLKTARVIPAEEIKNRLAEIPKDKLIITQCSTGIRAEMAYHALRELGYTNVKFVNAKIEFEKNGSYKIIKD